MLPNSALFSIVHAFNPAQLTLARELRGLLKHELAERVGKSPSAIGQFENGRARPEPQTLLALSLALGFPPVFFARTARAPVVAADSCQFRSQRSSSVREQRYVLARGEMLKELVTLLEADHVDFPEARVPHAPGPVRSLEDVEACAEMARREMKLGEGPIGSMVNELENIGVMVIPLDSDCRRVDAFSTWIARRPYIFLNSAKGSTSRARFDAAHELGHLVMHPDVVPGSPELERQADQFASAFLLPRTSFSKECPRRLNLQHLRELKVRWKVSLEALLYRGRELGFFSEASVRRAYVQLNRLGLRRNEPDEPPEERPHLLPSALSALLEAGGTHAEIAQDMGISPQELVALIEGRDLPDVVTRATTSLNGVQGEFTEFGLQKEAGAPASARDGTAHGGPKLVTEG
ncbi:XRE family transcriptional regulator [Pyxidicoccus xibeiensis]|uniref:XRE family transcriptional regulator n=1 Tax=Pyxidicoccus xibeiensis TaxID=2906759 RepID=UPI0020A7B180|nr:ImmA/IrrE family metallo-endopeptidase [Pyxidicoccus xibeiensis]MCP3143602.1 ImmA/IrrE family metallo-endopeptidase [Pyxidicoccus xibeiensis]